MTDYRRAAAALAVIAILGGLFVLSVSAGAIATAIVIVGAILRLVAVV